MPNDRDAAARLARKLIQAAGPPDKMNVTVYALVKQLAAGVVAGIDQHIRS